LPTGITFNTSTGVFTIAATAAAGEYTIPITATNAGGTSASVDLTYTITTAAPVVTAIIGSYTYNGSPQGPTSATNTGTGTNYTYSYTGVSGTTYGPSSTLPTNIGNYTVTATVAANGNYASASSSPTSFAIISTSTPVCPLSNAVTPSADQAMCQSTSASQLTNAVTTTGTTGTPTYSYQWYYNATNSNTIAGATTVGSATAATYTPLSTASQVGTRYYFCVAYATDNTCGQSSTTQSLASNTVKVTVYGPIAGNTSGAAVSICTSSSTTLTGGTASAGSGTYTYLWESSANNSTWTTAAGTSNTANYTTAALTSNTYFRRTVSSGGCSDVATSILVTVLDNFTTFYSKSAGNLNDVATWGSNSDGTGCSPANFTTAGITYVIQNNSAATTSAAWTVSGSGSIVKVGNGSSAITFLAGGDLSFDCDLEITGNATLNLNDKNMTLSGDLIRSASTALFNSGGTAGTVTFSGSSQNVNVTANNGTTPTDSDITFNHVTISGSNVKLFYFKTNDRKLNINNFTVNNGAVVTLYSNPQ
jgi:hypothetical protein